MLGRKGRQRSKERRDKGQRSHFQLPTTGMTQGFNKQLSGLISEGVGTVSMSEAKKKEKSKKLNSSIPEVQHGPQTGFR